MRMAFLTVFLGATGGCGLAPGGAGVGGKADDVAAQPASAFLFFSDDTSRAPSFTGFPSKPLAVGETELYDAEDSLGPIEGLAQIRMPVDADKLGDMATVGRPTLAIGVRTRLDADAARARLSFRLFHRKIPAEGNALALELSQAAIVPIVRSSAHQMCLRTPLAGCDQLFGDDSYNYYVIAGEVQSDALADLGSEVGTHWSVTLETDAADTAVIGLRVQWADSVEFRAAPIIGPGLRRQPPATDWEYGVVCDVLSIARAAETSGVAISPAHPIL